MIDWKPISELSPKNGDEYLLYGLCDGEIHGPYEAPCAVVAYFHGSRWFATVGDCYSTIVEPTHYAELEPPK